MIIEIGIRIIIYIVCVFGVLFFAIFLAKPAMKIFNWFEKIGWFD